jgi:DNA-binding NtrC family response regulator
MTAPRAGDLPFIGRSPEIQRTIALAEQFAPTNVPVLVLGATGTGKELLAQSIHRWSLRRGELVDVNCAALPRDLVDAELFGHGPRAFTGAQQAKIGLIEAANGSTLFLDELASLAWEAQGKLLRVLETGEVRRVGETAKRRVNVRVIAAAQNDLPQRVAAGAFRLDLYHRVAGLVLELPPLAARSKDVVLLAQHFAVQSGRVLGPGTERILMRHGWPGNVRALRLAVERAGHLATDGVIPAEELTEAIRLGAPQIGRNAQSQEIEDPAARDREALQRVLVDVGWDTVAAARLLGIHRATLYRRARTLGISLPRRFKVAGSIAGGRANSRKFARMQVAGVVDAKL